MMIILIGCESVPPVIRNVCPEAPEVTDEVADEYDKIPIEGFKHFHNFMGDILVLLDDLDDCHARTT